MSGESKPTVILEPAADGVGLFHCQTSGAYSTNMGESIPRRRQGHVEACLKLKAVKICSGGMARPSVLQREENGRKGPDTLCPAAENCREDLLLDCFTVEYTSDIVNWLFAQAVVPI